MVAYTKPQHRRKEESEQLRGERDQIKFIDLRFERWKVVGPRKARRGQEEDKKKTRRRQEEGKKKARRSIAIHKLHALGMNEIYHLT